MVAPLLIIGAVAGISVGLNILNEISQGTPIEEIPAELLRPQAYVEAISANPITRPLTEVADLFADTAEAAVALATITIFLITPNPANISNFDSLKRSFKNILSIPLVQILMVLILIGGSAAALIKNEELMKKVLKSAESFLFEKTDKKG